MSVSLEEVLNSLHAVYMAFTNPSTPPSLLMELHDKAELLFNQFLEESPDSDESLILMIKEYHNGSVFYWSQFLSLATSKKISPWTSVEGISQVRFFDGGSATNPRDVMVRCGSILELRVSFAHPAASDDKNWRHYTIDEVRELEGDHIQPADFKEIADSYLLRSNFVLL